MVTFKEYLITEAKLLGHAPEFKFASGQALDAEMAVDPNNGDAQRIISKVQRPKVDEVAKKLNLQWRMLFAKSHEQFDRFKRSGKPRLVWNYILVGNDPEGNEVAYYKYEAGPGSGQSHVYGNRKNKTKLTWILDSTPAQAKEQLGFTKVKRGGPIPTDEADLVKFLKRRFRKATIIKDDKGHIRLVVRTGKNRWSKRQEGYSFVVRKWGKKTKVGYERLDGIKEIKKGYTVPTPSKYGRWMTGGKTHPVGLYDDVNTMLKDIRKIIK